MTYYFIYLTYQIIIKYLISGNYKKWINNILEENINPDDIFSIFNYESILYTTIYKIIKSLLSRHNSKPEIIINYER